MYREGVIDEVRAGKNKCAVIASRRETEEPTTRSALAPVQRGPAGLRQTLNEKRDGAAFDCGLRSALPLRVTSGPVPSLERESRESHLGCTGLATHRPQLCARWLKPDVTVLSRKKKKCNTQTLPRNLNIAGRNSARKPVQPAAAHAKQYMRARCQAVTSSNKWPNTARITNLSATQTTHYACARMRSKRLSTKRTTSE